MALLEEAARQLYREWFVRLRFPGHEHTRIANGVPDGWEHQILAKACLPEMESRPARLEASFINPIIRKKVYPL